MAMRTWLQHHRDQGTRAVRSHQYQSNHSADMQEHAKRGKGLWYLKSIAGIFDDQEHFKRIKAVSGLTHPALEEVTDVSQLHIRSVVDLQRIVRTKLDLNFCDICLSYRQVFTSEQLLYTKEGLLEHKQKGDAEGPLAEAQFKGHPRCQCVPKLAAKVRHIWMLTAIVQCFMRSVVQILDTRGSGWYATGTCQTLHLAHVCTRALTHSLRHRTSSKLATVCE